MELRDQRFEDLRRKDQKHSCRGVQGPNVAGREGAPTAKAVRFTLRSEATRVATAKAVECTALVVRYIQKGTCYVIATAKAVGSNLEKTKTLILIPISVPTLYILVFDFWLFF